MVTRQVTTRYGIVEGLATQDPNITAFRGVPFAAAPVGEYRWRAPQPVRPWTGVLPAHDFAPISMQPMSQPTEFYGREWSVDPDTPTSEDCLYLNIWTPSLRGSGTAHCVDERQSKLPVLVWIYGGAYQCGSTVEKEFDGSSLACRGVVVVTIAYRLNVFGFFTHADLNRSDGSDEPVANFGLLDQHTAIAWVKDNIAVFGGDPNNITVAGQSAGSASVLAQCASSMSGNLFQHAIMQSGGGLGVFNKHLWSLEESQHNGERFLSFLGVKSVKEARKIPANELLDAACAFPVPPDSGRDGDWPMLVNWIPCVDGRFLTGQYGDSLLSQDRRHPIDLLVGNTTGEFTITGDDGTPVPEGELGNIALARTWIDAGNPRPFFYQFDVQMPGDDAGAFHSSDLWFTFNSLHTCWRPFSGWHYELSNTMCDYWANFMHTGNPNSTNHSDSLRAEWTAFDPQTPQAMRFGRKIGMQPLMTVD